MKKRLLYLLSSISLTSPFFKLLVRKESAEDLHIRYLSDFAAKNYWPSKICSKRFILEVLNDLRNSQISTFQRKKWSHFCLLLITSRCFVRSMGAKTRNYDRPTDRQKTDKSAHRKVSLPISYTCFLVVNLTLPLMDM